MANNITAAVGRSHTVMASAARTATPNTEELELPAGTNYATFVINVSAVVATPDLVMKVEGVDRASGAVWLLLADASVATVSVSTLQIGPGITAAANVSAAVPVPPVVRVTVTHGDADSATYSVGAHFS